MGYSTDFYGQFKVDRKVDDETLAILLGLANTRRVKRKVDAKYGVEGEFYFKGDGFLGQDRDSTVVDYNSPPRTQPSLWCQWAIDESDRQTIQWDGGEKFYCYVEWIEYILNKVLLPRGYKLTGQVSWQGEDSSDRGQIIADGDSIRTGLGRIVYDF